MRGASRGVTNVLIIRENVTALVSVFVTPDGRGSQLTDTFVAARRSARAVWIRIGIGTRGCWRPDGAGANKQDQSKKGYPSAHSLAPFGYSAAAVGFAV